MTDQAAKWQRLNLTYSRTLSLKKISSNVLVTTRTFIIVVFILSMFLNNGCTSITGVAPASPQNFAQNQINLAEAAFYRGDYDTAICGYVPVAYQYPEQFRLPKNITDEARAGIADAYLRLIARPGIPADIIPGPALDKFGVSKEKLHKGFSRLLKDRNYRVAFYAARALASQGDSSGRDILMKGLGGNYNVNDFIHFKVPFHSIDKKKTRSDVAAEAIIALRTIDGVEISGQLIDILEDSQNYNSDLRAYTAYELGKSREKDAIDALIKAASYKDEKVSSMAIWSLGEMREYQARDVFIKGLKAKDIKVVNESITALGKLADPQATPYLDNTLQKNGNIETKIRALSTIAQIGSDDAFKVLLREAKNKFSEVRVAALSALSKYNTSESTKAITDAFGDKEVLVRATAVNIASTRISKYPEITGLTIELLENENDDNVKLVGLNSLRGIEDVRIKDLAFKFLEEDDWHLRQVAVLSLDQYWDDHTYEKIVKILDDAEEQVRQAAVLVGVSKLKEDPKIFEPLYKKLNDPSKIVSSTTAVALSSYVEDYPQLKELLENILRGHDTQLKKGILFGLGQAKGKIAFDMVKPFVESKDPVLKQVAVLSLAYSDVPEAIDVIKPFADDPLVEVREVTALSLGVKQDIKALNLVRKLTRDESPRVRAIAIESFASFPVGDSPQSLRVAELQPFLDDPSPVVRITAAKILTPEIADFSELETKFIKLAKFDDDVMVKSVATLGLGWGNIDKPEAINVIKDNLRSNNLGLGQASALALGRINSPATIAPLTSIALDYKQDRLLQDAAIAGLGYKFSYHNPVNIEIDTPEHKRYWTDQLAYSAQIPLKHAQMEKSDNSWNNPSTYPDQEYYKNVIKPIENYNPAEVGAELKQIENRAFERMTQPPSIVGFPGQNILSVIDNVKNAEDDLDLMEAWFDFAREAPQDIPVFGDMMSRTVAANQVLSARYYRSVIETDLQTLPSIRNLAASLNKDIAGINRVHLGSLTQTGIMPDYQRQIYVQNQIPKPSISDTWQQRHIMGEDSWNQANQWSNMAIPPGGTGFNPNYMSTPPPGMENIGLSHTQQWYKDVERFNITTFNPRYMSTPPQGSVYINTGLPDKGIYIGGDSYIPPIKTEQFRPIDIPQIQTYEPVKIDNSWRK